MRKDISRTMIASTLLGLSLVVTSCKEPENRESDTASNGVPSNLTTQNLPNGSELSEYSSDKTSGTRHQYR